MKFRVVFNPTTFKTGIHALDCSAGQPHYREPTGALRIGQRANGSTTWEEEAPTAKGCADKVYAENDFEERKIRRPHLCKCVK